MGKSNKKRIKQHKPSKPTLSQETKNKLGVLAEMKSGNKEVERIGNLLEVVSCFWNPSLHLLVQSQLCEIYYVCEIYSKLTKKAPERLHWRCFGVCIVNFQQMSYIVLVSLLLNLNKYKQQSIILEKLLILKMKIVTRLSLLLLHYQSS